MNARLIGGIHDGAGFELMDPYDPPPELLHVFKCPHCDNLHHADPEDYVLFIQWQEKEDPDNPPMDEELYSLKEVQTGVAIYEQVGLAMPTVVEERDLAYA